MVKAIEQRGARDIAKRALETTGQIFRFAIAHGYAKRNPASEIRPRDVLKAGKRENHARVSSPSTFTQEDGGGIVMSDATRREIITQWQRRKQQEVEHPFLKEVIPIGLIPYVQALLLARHLRGGLANYPAFLWR